MRDSDLITQVGCHLGTLVGCHWGTLVGLGCGNARARPRRYTGLVAGWSTAGASQDRTWRKGCGDTRARPRRYTGLVCGRISHRFDCQDQVFTNLRAWGEEGSWMLDFQFLSSEILNGFSSGKIILECHRAPN